MYAITGATGRVGGLVGAGAMAGATHRPWTRARKLEELRHG